MRALAMVFLYGGPDQLMPVASSLAAICAALFLLFNRILAGFHRLANRFHRKPDTDSNCAAEQNPRLRG